MENKEEYNYKNWEFGFLHRGNFDLCLKMVREQRGHHKMLCRFPWYADFCVPPRFFGGDIGLEPLPSKYIPCVVLMEVYEVVMVIAMSAMHISISKAEQRLEEMDSELEKKLVKKKPHKHEREKKRHEAAKERLRVCLDDVTKKCQLCAKVLEEEREKAQKEYEVVYTALHDTGKLAETAPLRKARIACASVTLGDWVRATELFYHKVLALSDMLHGAVHGSRVDQKRLDEKYLQGEGLRSIYYAALRREASQPLTVDFRIVSFSDLPEKAQKVGVDIAQRANSFLEEMNRKMEEAQRFNAGSKDPFEMPELKLVLEEDAAFEGDMGEMTVVDSEDEKEDEKEAESDKESDEGDDL